jgi:hypothetical protein
MNQTLSDLIRREEAKRQRCWDPAARWKVIQETIAWAEAQATVRRNTKEACLANQQRILAERAAYETRKSASST